GPSLVAPVFETPAPARDFAAEATAAFKAARYEEAAALFAAATRLTAEQQAAWAYCRVKVGADRVNSPACSPEVAAAVAQDVTDALRLVPSNADLQKYGQQLIRVAGAKAGAHSDRKGANSDTVPAASGDTIETASFRVVHGGNRELADAVARAAEAGRKHIFERWSGPPAGAWQPKCEIVLHPTADAYEKATGRPAVFTGHASVGLTNGRATARRIDLRADDAGLVANTLPRELTHVVLADLFAAKPPPRWAEEGMAVLAGSPEEVERYTRTLARCARDGELRTLATLFELKDIPADKVTGFYCQSVSVAAFLIDLKGERNFKIFLSDAQRHGTAQALKRQYGIDSVAALEQAWKRASLEPR
ncbi:MAG: hypothetical protein K2V38_04055, partial [Gemmataceae bacterium]|nr:hypothetical protein [Gemmataceae bacterium]